MMRHHSFTSLIVGFSVVILGCAMAVGAVGKHRSPGATRPATSSGLSNGTSYDVQVVPVKFGADTQMVSGVALGESTSTSSSSSPMDAPTTTSSTPTTTTTGTTSQPPPPADCTVVDSSLTDVVSDAASKPDGSTICIAPGSYGTLTLAAARTGYVTISAQNGPGTVALAGLHIDSSGDFLHLDGLNITSNTELGTRANGGTAPSDVQITNTVSQGFQVEAGAENLLFDHDTSQGGPDGFMLNGSRHPVDGGCCRTANYPLIQNVTIEHSLVGPLDASGADAFQVKGFNNLTIADNDIYDIYQNGNHNDGIQTVHGGSNLTIDHNWFHHGNIELFMIKDGDITGTNAITDNLVDDENASENPACGGCSTAVFAQYYSPQNATIANNTIVEPGLFLRSQLRLVGNGNPDYLPPSNINVNHNVVNQFRAQDDDQGGAEGAFTSAMTTSDNLFGTYTRNYLSPGPGDTFTSAISDTSSLFTDPANNDFRLADNPNAIGVDWVPDPSSYGPQR